MRLVHCSQASKLIALFVFCFALATDAAGVEPKSQIKHVIVVSVDGLGAKLLRESEAPFLKKLIAKTPQVLKAETVIPSTTVAGHTSMLTGVDPSRHKLTHNEMDNDLTRVAVPSIFNLLKDNGLSSCAVFGKSKLKFVFDTGALTYPYLPKQFPFGDFWGRFPSIVTDRAKKEIKKRRPAFLFIHHSMVDTMGHWFRWENWPQKRALLAIDKSIEKIAEAAKKEYGDGHFALIVTADHGGHGGSHGQTNEDGTLQSPETDLYIPWIIYGAKIADPNRVVKVYDTAAAVADLLNLKVPADWNWQGKSPLEARSK